jgi:hypothetical protein
VVRKCIYIKRTSYRLLVAWGWEVWTSIGVIKAHEKTLIKFVVYTYMYVHIESYQNEHLNMCNLFSVKYTSVKLLIL